MSSVQISAHVVKRICKCTVVEFLAELINCAGRCYL